MISWQEAEEKIASVWLGTQKAPIDPVMLHGLAALSSVMTNFGYNLIYEAIPADRKEVGVQPENYTSRNWAGDYSDIYQHVEKVTPEACWKWDNIPSAWGSKYDGSGACFERYADDESGIWALLSYVLLSQNKPVRDAAMKGEVHAFAFALWQVPGKPGQGGGPATQFLTIDDLADALTLHLQDLEQKTGIVSGWTYHDKPVSQVFLQGPNVKSGGGTGGGEEESGSGASGLLVGGAIAAVALGLLYAATKAK